MSPSIFLCHNHKDKAFVRKLARDLEGHGIKYWLDEAEMKVGDSLIKKIREGIDDADYFAVVLSPDSVNAPWVLNELDVAMNHQINGRNIKVLPIMLKQCDPPGFLLGKYYADFRDEEKYNDSFRQLVNSMDIVFSKSSMSPEGTQETLETGVNKAITGNLPIMCAPFHRPFQYIGMTIDRAEKLLGVVSNKDGNIIVENSDCRMLLEAEGNYLSYIEVAMKRAGPHRQNQEFDSEAVLGSLSIGLSELELVQKQTHCHTYYNHRKRLKVSVLCPYDGAPLTVGFSEKYYGM